MIKRQTLFNVFKFPHYTMYRENKVIVNSITVEFSIGLSVLKSPEPKNK